MTTQQDREELIKRMLEIADRQFSSKRPIYHTVGLLRRAAALLAADGQAGGEVVGYLPAYELSRLNSGHDANLRSAKFGPSALDGDVPVYTRPQPAAQEWKCSGPPCKCDASNFRQCCYSVPAAQVAQPLTEEECEALIEDLAEWSRHVVEDTAHETLEKHVRRVLAAHGIGKDQA